MTDEAPPARGFSVRDIALLSVVGAGSALFAELFRHAGHGFYRLVHREGVVDFVTRLPFAARAAVITGACIVAALLAQLASRLGSGGVTTIAAAIQEGTRVLSISAALVRSTGALIAMTLGASIGREGPLIQFGASLGQRVGAHSRVADVRAREFIAAGTAAGFAAAYNAPIAGALFVIEVMPRLPVRLTAARVGVATVTSALVAHALSSSRPLYGARLLEFDKSAHLLGYGLLALISGALGVLVMRAVRFGRSRPARRRLPRWLWSLSAALAAAFAIALSPIAAGNGYDGILTQLATPPTVAMALLLVAIKLVATVAAVSSGAPGGVFTPSMFLGASLAIAVQQALGTVAPWMTGSVTSMAFVGMSSLVAATTHAPLTAAVLAIELSGSTAITLPVLFAVGLSALVARRLDPDNIYEVESAEHAEH
jgi:CIC family chloride channel protein